MMAEMDVEKMRQMFKSFNRFMLLMWRLGLGPWVNIWPEFIGRIMVITHTGRKTGLRRRTPVNYAIMDGEIYCLAGYGEGSDWYRNMLANPEVEVWLPDGWWAGEMADISDSEDRLMLLRQVLIASGFAAPMFAGFDPKTISDEELDEQIKDYRLIHIRRTTACTGTGGPGDLSIVWPVVVIMMIPLLCVILFFRKRR
ncbi:MAG: nitroreductase family deazaflavin-dependent oxidoreductase [Anaerolineaceae bacterium]|nr:nitroreductase family deazaflavin-dependent oxidoreductase [Anaerolineaceae bacterium]